MFLSIFIPLLLSTASGQFTYQQSGINQEECCQEYCYVTDEEPYINFATKTAYDSINKRSGSQHIVPDCTPIQFWSLNRYGTRLPKADRIQTLRNLQRLHDEIVLNYEQRRSYPDKGRLCIEDYNIFKVWHWNQSITEEKANSLTVQGIEELKLLARRYKSKYSQILKGGYDERTFYFQYADSDKTHASYQAYIEGLFGNEAYRVHANTLSNDKLLKPYENCETWSKNQEQYGQVKSEYEKFMERPEYQQLVRDVFRRLGFKYTLNASIVNDIYDMCRYEKAWNVQQRSPWCIAFNKDQLKLLEYAQDLKYYYQTGYGNKLSQRLGCAATKDFYDRFDKTISGTSDGNRGTFLFADSATLQAVVTTLGIAKDYTPLTADNYYQQSRRNWRTSIIDPFAGNLVAVLYQCRGNEKYKVMFFLNEIPVEFSDCSVGLCDWSMLQRKYEDLIRTCDIDEICSGNSGQIKYFNFENLLLCAVYFFLKL